MLVPVSHILSLNQSCHLACFLFFLLLSGSKKQILTHFPRPWDLARCPTSCILAAGPWAVVGCQLPLARRQGEGKAHLPHSFSSRSHLAAQLGHFKTVWKLDEGFGAGTPALLSCWGDSREGGAGKAGCVRGGTVPLLLPYPEHLRREQLQPWHLLSDFRRIPLHQKKIQIKLKELLFHKHQKVTISSWEFTLSPSS